MTTREKLKIVIEIITFPLMCIWWFADGFFFVPARIERALRESRVRAERNLK